MQLLNVRHTIRLFAIRPSPPNRMQFLLCYKSSFQRVVIVGGNLTVFRVRLLVTALPPSPPSHRIRSLFWSERVEIWWLRRRGGGGTALRIYRRTCRLHPHTRIFLSNSRCGLSFFGNRATTKAGVWFQEDSLLLRTTLFYRGAKKAPVCDRAGREGDSMLEAPSARSVVTLF